MMAQKQHWYYTAQKHPTYPRAEILAPIGFFHGEHVVEYWRRGKMLGAYTISQSSYRKFKEGKPIRLMRSGEWLRPLFR